MIVVGTTIAPWKCDGRQELAWLDNAEEIVASHPAGVLFFAALEVDGRGGAPYLGLTGRFIEVCTNVGNVVTDEWSFAIDDHTEQVDSGNRLIRICTGRNLVHEYAMRNKEVTHILFVDSDITIPGNSIPKLLELKRPVCGGRVGIYALGDNLPSLLPGTYGSAFGRENEAVVPEGADVREHWNTAGFLMLERQVFSQVAWHYNLDAGLTDDPEFQRATREIFGETWVRHDLLGVHVDIPMVAVEHRGSDMRRVPW